MRLFRSCLLRILLISCVFCPLTFASGTHRFTLNLQDVPLRDALQLLADEMELNLVMSDEVTGNISVHVEQLDLAQTLDVLLFGKSLAFRLSDTLLAVAPAPRLQEFDLAQQQRKLAADVLHTEYMQLNYADAQTLLTLLTGAESVTGSVAETAAGTAETDAGNVAGLLSASGFAQIDARTNTLIVSDTPERLSAIRELLTVLDVPVRQVLIEAKIVSAALDTGRELGVRWGLTGIANGVSAGVSGGTGSGTEESEANGPPLASQSGLSAAADHHTASLARFVVLRDQRLLDLEISALERAGQAELIARPRVTTQDNMPALIQSGVRIPYQAQAGGTAGGSTTEFVDALLSLDVTPLITPDGRIIMRLNIRQDSVATGSGDVPAINTNTITTSVLVENGDTLVLGGIFREEQTHAQAGTPGLSKVPLLGALFRRRVSASHRTELLVFITPEILNNEIVQEAAAPALSAGGSVQ